jgi:hypothetical protein
VCAWLFAVLCCFALVDGLWCGGCVPLVSVAVTSPSSLVRVSVVWPLAYQQQEAAVFGWSFSAFVTCCFVEVCVVDAVFRVGSHVGNQL